MKMGLTYITFMGHIQRPFKLLLETKITADEKFSFVCCLTDALLTTSYYFPLFFCHGLRHLTRE